MKVEYIKRSSVISKGEKEGAPVYTQGAKVRFLGLPVKPTGAIALSGSVIGFEGSFDGTNWFTIVDHRGIPLGIVPKASQLVIPQNGLVPAPAHLPIKDMDLFEGIQFVRPVSNLAESQEQTIEFYIE